MPDSASALREPHALDADQRRIVDLPVTASAMVIGAAGSGKTSAVVSRVSALLAQGAASDEVLVLTTSRQSATHLRDRLALAAGVATSGPLARSLTAFAFALVRAQAARTGAAPPQLLTGTDEDRMLHDLLDGDAEDEQHGAPRWPDGLGAEIRSTVGFRAELRALLAACTEQGIDPDALRRRGAAHPATAAVWPAVASFAEEYARVRAAMRGAHRDAPGLVAEARALALDADRVLEPWPRLRTLIVDDAQELTAGGVDLLLACRRRGVSVLAFADPDIGSGAFRGAGAEHLIRLAADTPIMTLRGRHRGGAAHHDLLARVTSRIGAAGLVAHRHAPAADAARPADAGAVETFIGRSAAEEYDTIARVLRERRLLDGVAWEHCVVIAHDTRQVAALERELAARDVPTRAASGQQLAERRTVRDLLLAVELAALDPAQRTADDVTALLGGAGIDPLALRRLRTTLRQRTDDPVTGGAALREAFAHPVQLDLLDTRDARLAAAVARADQALRELLATGATAHELLWAAWEPRAARLTAAANGRGAAADEARREIDAVATLLQAAKRHGERGDGTSPLQFVRSVRESAIAEDRLGGAGDGEVRVLTPAGALGIEADTVVIAGVQDGVWPNLRVRGSLLEGWRLALDTGADPDLLDRRRDVLHDELRLFARAVSRATSRVVVTAVADDDTGPSALFELLPEPTPVPADAAHPFTLRGLVAKHRRTITQWSAGRSDYALEHAPSVVRHAAGQLAILAAAGVDGADPAHWYGLRGSAVASTGDGAAPAGEQPAEPTRPAEHAPASDAFDGAPVRVSPSRLQRIEDCELDWVVADLGGDPGSAAANLGTIIHGALETAPGADEEALWRAVDARWGELEFDAPWRGAQEHTRARELVRRLAVYLRDAERAGTALVGAESHFEISVPGVDGAVLSGSIDRVEQTADGRVLIIDLKTGRREPQTDAKVADHPQLAAYQLAFEAGVVGAAPDAAPGGAALLVLRPTAAGKDYVLPRQLPFDDESRSAFVARLADAVQVMRGDTFTAAYEQHCRDDHTYGVCRIHTIGAVSSA